jgi:hypothetical protein
VKPEVVLQALLAIWDELPTLIGADWPKVHAELERQIERLRATGDPDVTADLILVLRPYAPARERLRAEIDRMESSDAGVGAPPAGRLPEPPPSPPFGSSGIEGVVGDSDAPPRVTRGRVTRGLPPASPAPVPAGPSVGALTDELLDRVAADRPRAAPAPPAAADDAEPAPPAVAEDAGPAPGTATCHVRAEMDGELTRDQVTTLEVTVSREAIGGVSHQAAAEAAATVDTSKRLIIQVLPKSNIHLESDGRAEIEVPATGDPQTIYFDLRPTDPGQAVVWVVARQGQVPLLTLKLTADIRSTAAGRSSKRASAESETNPAPAHDEPLHQLRISQVQRGDTLLYEYELEAPTLGILQRFESRPITSDPQQYVAALFKHIEDRWLSTNSDVEEFTQELREYGGELLDELIPDPLQGILWDNRDRLTSIQVLATEPFIPWELVHLREPGRPLPKETIFLGQLGLTRWLYDSGWPPEKLRVRPKRAHYLIPEYPDPRYALPEAVAEAQFLKDSFGATAVEPQPTPVRALLSEKGAFDLLHFAGHGAADSGAISEARLLLQGRMEDNQYIEASLTTTTVSNRSDLTDADGSRPIVVLNACQAGRLGYRLTGVGGFAQAFLTGGAGAFVGTQWSVGDSPARVFTETFYRELLAGKTVAEATTAAREQARQDGDATWLAYAVYAHPNATLVH